MTGAGNSTELRGASLCVTCIVCKHGRCDEVILSKHAITMALQSLAAASQSNTGWQRRCMKPLSSGNYFNIEKPWDFPMAIAEMHVNVCERETRPAFARLESHSPTNGASQVIQRLAINVLRACRTLLQLGSKRAFHRSNFISIISIAYIR